MSELKTIESAIRIAFDVFDEILNLPRTGAIFLEDISSKKVTTRSYDILKDQAIAKELEKNGVDLIKLPMGPNARALEEALKKEGIHFNSYQIDGKAVIITAPSDRHRVNETLYKSIESNLLKAIKEKSFHAECLMTEEGRNQFFMMSKAFAPGHVEQFKKKEKLYGQVELNKYAKEGDASAKVNGFSTKDPNFVWELQKRAKANNIPIVVMPDLHGELKVRYAAKDKGMMDIIKNRVTVDLHGPAKKFYQKQAEWEQKNMLYVANRVMASQYILHGANKTNPETYQRYENGTVILAKDGTSIHFGEQGATLLAGDQRIFLAYTDKNFAQVANVWVFDKIGSELVETKEAQYQAYMQASETEKEAFFLKLEKESAPHDLSEFTGIDPKRKEEQIVKGRPQATKEEVEAIKKTQALWELRARKMEQTKPLHHEEHMPMDEYNDKEPYTSYEEKKYENIEFEKEKLEEELKKMDETIANWVYETNDQEEGISLEEDIREEEARIIFDNIDIEVEQWEQDWADTKEEHEPDR